MITFPLKIFLSKTALCSFVTLLFAGGMAQERAPKPVMSQPQPERHYALVIGNNAYQSIRKLKTAEADAREIAGLLRTQYGFQTRLLLNATRVQIITAFNSYRRELDENSSLLIYYAGHGINDKEIERAYWLPVDARLDNNSNWISADDITSNIKGIPAKHVLVVSDSCYSGTLTRGLEASLPAPSERQRYLQKMMAGKSRTLMASGGNEPVADGGGGNHSIFAKALLRGLSVIDRTEFTASELFRDFVEESVAGRANQTPEYNPLRNSGHESGDFVFSKTKGGAKAGGEGGIAQSQTTTPTATVEKDEPPPSPDLTPEATPASNSGEGTRAGFTDLTGSSWTGNNPITGEFFIEFLKAGQLRYLITVRENGANHQRAVNGTWQQTGDIVRLVIGNSYSVLQGRIDGYMIRAEGENQEGQKLNFLLMKTLPKAPK